MIKEPYYMIEFDASACMFEIQINKVSLLTLNVEGQVASTNPINYLILESGLQQLDITVYPNIGKTQFDKNSDFSAIVKLFDVSDGFDEIEDIITCRIDEGEKILPVYKYKNCFTAEVPYKLTAWQESVDLDTIENLRKKVVSAYIKLQDIITKGQYNTFRKMLREREENMAISLYLDKESSEARLDRLIHRFQNGYEIEPLSDTEIMHLYADNRLVGLKTVEGDSALRLRHKETNQTLTIEVLFHLKQGETELSVM
jgi:hypothetical protein